MAYRTKSEKAAGVCSRCEPEGRRALRSVHRPDLFHHLERAQRVHARSRAADRSGQWPVGGGRSGAADAAGQRVHRPHANAEVLPHGETGVLEAYQRAIMKAEEYIYIEDQYFNSEEIVEAIKARMIERPQLEVIIVMNPRPDIGGYHPHQTGLIKDLIKAGSEDRVAVFTMWTCDPANPKLEVAPVYVHSKVCIIDDRWVAIGTANVDGASMNAAAMADHPAGDSVLELRGRGRTCRCRSAVRRLPGCR